MSVYVDLAKKTVSKYLTNERLLKTEKLPKEFLKRAGCFVSIHVAKTNALRGCIGTIAPVYKNLASEIIANATSAAFHDPRFAPVKISELKNLKFSVDVLGEPELIKSVDKLDPKKFGVIVKSIDGRTGLLLPALDGVDTVAKQIEIALEKAGINDNKDVLLYRFTAKRYE